MGMKGRRLLQLRPSMWELAAVWGRVGEICCDHLLGAFKLGNCLRPVFSFVCVCYSSHDEQSPHVCSGELASYIIYDFSIWSAEQKQEAIGCW